MAKSLISIIVPCYLQAQYMDEALQSVLDQTYSNWECIIVNDGSPDNTEEVAHEWLEKDARFKYIYKQNGGLSSARNLGIEKAIGNYIQFLDSDDVLLPSKIEDSIAKINLFKEEKFKLVISNFRMFVDDKNVTQEPYCLLKNEYFTLENVLYNWEEKFTIPIHCGFFEASLFEKLKFNEKLKAKEDWLMWVNIFLNNKFSIFINQPLVLYRKNPLSMTMTKVTSEDYWALLKEFKVILTLEQFEKFTQVLLTRYYNAVFYYKNELNIIKQTNTYKLGFLLKKIIFKLRLLSFFKSLFNRFLKIKYISKSM